MPTSEFEVLRVSSDSVLQDIYHLRYEIFTRDQAKFLTIADHDQKMLVDQLDTVAEHFIVQRRGTIIASLRVIHGVEKLHEQMAQNLDLSRFDHIDPSKISISGRLFVVDEHRKSRALFALLKHCYRLGRDHDIKFDFLYCNPHLVPFYEQLGYRRYKDCFEDQHLGFQVPLVQVLDDVEHFERVRSPFRAEARKRPSDQKLATWFKETFSEYNNFVSPLSVGAGRFMEIMSDKLAHADAGLMQDLDEDERALLIESSNHLYVASGVKLIREGDFGKELYLILDGVAEARASRMQKSLVLATFGKGDVFGEMALVSSRRRSADIIALTPLEVAYFDDDSLKRLIQRQPAIAAKVLYNLSRILAERLERTSYQALNLSGNL